MAVLINQGNRPLRTVAVRARNTNEMIEFHQPEGYDFCSISIGSGTYGIVARANGSHLDQSGNRISIELAVKKFRATTDATRFATLIYRELKLLQHLDHPNISRIVDLYTPAQCPDQLDQIYLVTEYVGSTLDKHLIDQNETNHRLPATIIPNIIRDTLRALQYLEAANVLHRDLSPSNLAINNSGKTVLIDFGLARTAKTESDQLSPYTANVCTFSYAAPEINFWHEGQYDREADIWSVGCILAELVTWETLFKDARSKIIQSIELFGPIPPEFIQKAREESHKKYMRDKNGTTAGVNMTEYFARSCKVPDLTVMQFIVVIDFLEECLKFNPDSRITINNALRHPFLTPPHQIYVPEDHSQVQPLVYNDSARSIEQWEETLFDEIQNFSARSYTPRP
ncbi:hypothetical protein PENTCL1PPCAC_8901 [Pristionchus entomophagus]|uniref:Protein kinase domain-containing protein n=1 Tax=Pristionchus entomophagus TaxID=358040 RepID=A0AAV5STQ4_9BILA|nr:hypothetical protein PENTCL1PPCAC_8901 [Pristionchus entomophagus]